MHTALNVVINLKCISSYNVTCFPILMTVFFKDYNQMKGINLSKLWVFLGILSSDISQSFFSTLTS